MRNSNIFITAQNNEWLKQQVANGVFASKSEAINYLIKQAREQDAYIELVQMKLDKAEKSGFAEKQTKEEMLAEFKKKCNVK